MAKKKKPRELKEKAVKEAHANRRKHSKKFCIVEDARGSQ